MMGSQQIDGRRRPPSDPVAKFWIGVFLILLVGAFVYLVVLGDVPLPLGIGALVLGLVAPPVLSLPAGRGKVAGWKSQLEIFGLPLVGWTFWLVTEDSGAGIVYFLAYLLSFGLAARILPSSMVRLERPPPRRSRG